ncbi:uncharacterized protein LOC142978895 [Anticarsia gemmatalis]|uniref:uncharacterized protein LOC142978895 n=1 Tax=Anticarsia gemmatalis TaxID=129554 RepID=UPI003F775CB2
MNTPETAGESSRKGRENGDASNESERPLKKARFAWQVKGKYHLKNDINETVKTPTETAFSPDVSEISGSSSNNDNRDTEQKLEILGDYLKNPVNNKLKTVFINSDQSLTPSTGSANDSLLYPQYVNHHEQSVNSNVLKWTSASSNSYSLHSISTILSQNYAEDLCIARWQYKQMVKGSVDNSINVALDRLMQSQSSLDHPSRTAALDAAQFVNNLPEDNSVENEGILMAISAHGLQFQSRCLALEARALHPHSTSSTNDDQECNDDTNDADEFNYDDALTLSPSDDEESQEAANQSDLSSNEDTAWSDSDDQKNERDDTTLYTFPDDSSQQNPSVEDPIHDSVGNSRHAFLDEAILFAIHSKGLTTLGSGYG